MASPQSIDVAARAKRIYEERLKESLESEHRDEFVAIEPDSGDHFLAPSFSEAAAAARTAHPGRTSFVLRVGHPTALEFARRAAGVSRPVTGASVSPFDHDGTRNR